MLWKPVIDKTEVFKANGEPASIAMQNAISAIMSEQVKISSIPRRFSSVVRDIWYLQHRFNYRHGRRARSLLEHTKFRAAYDFMCLRSKAGELSDDSCEWWTNIQTLSSEQQEKLLKPARHTPRKRRKSKQKN